MSDINNWKNLTEQTKKALKREITRDIKDIKRWLAEDNYYDIESTYWLRAMQYFRWVHGREISTEEFIGMRDEHKIPEEDKMPEEGYRK